MDQSDQSSGDPGRSWSPTKYPSADRAALLPGTDRRPDLSLDDAIATFDREAIRNRFDGAEQERRQLVERFPLTDWPTMALDRYALGQPNWKNSFSYWLEFQTQHIASIRGGSSMKHLIFWRNRGEWYFER